MIDTILRDALPSDILYIDSQRKREGSALGFIPKAVYESVVFQQPIDGRRRWEYSRLIVVEDNGDQTGFCFCSFSGEYVRIFQIVVREDVRRWLRAAKMVHECEIEAARRYKAGIRCRVAIDLESNLFWQAMGFIPVGMVSSTWLNQCESQSKRPLIIYEKALAQPRLPLPMDKKEVQL